ncbi:hypothetical protein F2Q68_00002506 [Brassica cretica]|uniref:Nucleotide-diphospho-sugar transferase domain-containing protein n=1 Tax=Brassica cretica TaxID=69181 RepID=A0A8S9JL95_BRACR|nr:hypothetical protein F2Q68_00002506 [Brassica cretica]
MIISQGLVRAYNLVEISVHELINNGFFNFTARRPQHLLQIVELGYSVMYNDVDMVWLQDPFKYLEGRHDAYFMDDMTAVDLYLLPQAAFPTGGLYFKNKTWVKDTKGKHVIIHNNYIVGFEKKIKRFRDYGLWLVDDHALESPLGNLE